MTGVGYNPKKTGRELTSINDIFDPKYKGQGDDADRDAGYARPRDAGDGEGPTKVTKADVAAAAAKIKKARTSGQIRKFTATTTPRTCGGGQHRHRLRLVGRHPGAGGGQPGFSSGIAPKEGAMLYSDNMLIPKTSDRQDLAMAWINYVYDPKHSAQIVAGAPYLSDAKGTGAEPGKIAPALASSPLVNPPDELRARLHVFRALSDAEDTEYNRIFQDAIGA